MLLVYLINILSYFCKTKAYFNFVFIQDQFKEYFFMASFSSQSFSYLGWEPLVLYILTSVWVQRLGAAHSNAGQNMNF